MAITWHQPAKQFSLLCVPCCFIAGDSALAQTVEISGSARQKLSDNVRAVVPFKIVPEGKGGRRDVSLRPRLELELDEQFGLSTGLILRHRTNPEYVTVGGRLEPHLSAGDLLFKSSLESLFDSYTDDASNDRQHHTVASPIFRI